MHRALIAVFPFVIWMSACGGAQQGPDGAPAEGQGAAKGSTICSTPEAADPSKPPACAQGCEWDQKLQKCVEQRGAIMEYGTPTDPSAPPPPPPPPPPPSGK